MPSIREFNWICTADLIYIRLIRLFPGRSIVLSPAWDSHGLFGILIIKLNIYFLCKKRLI